jgi:hypothetical protein
VENERPPSGLFSPKGVCFQPITILRILPSGHSLGNPPDLKKGKAEDARRFGGPIGLSCFRGKQGYRFVFDRLVLCIFIRFAKWSKERKKYGLINPRTCGMNLKIF